MGKKLSRLSKSGIEYLDYAWNFYSGCENWATGVCGGGGQHFNCWARSITERFPAHYPNGFNPTFYPEAFLSPMSLKKPSRIGVAFMGDLFGDWINYTDKNGTVTPRNIVYPVVERCPQHTFLFLTKCPWNLIKWGKFPDNCWVGVTTTSLARIEDAYKYLAGIEASVKYLSLEPFLYWDMNVFQSYTAGMLKFAGIKWAIIGLQTPYNPKTAPKIEWVEEIVRACDKVGVPVFQKDNLKPLLGNNLRQELPQ